MTKYKLRKLKWKVVKLREWIFYFGLDLLKKKKIHNKWWTVGYSNGLGHGKTN